MPTEFNWAWEKRQLLLLASLTILIPAAWIVFFGWVPGELIAQGDHLDLGLIYQRELTRVNGDWTQALYWPGLGGGVKVHDVAGSMPIDQLLGFLQVNLTTFGNLVVFTVQLLFAYLCVSATTGLTAVLFDDHEPAPVLPLLLLGLMFAFLPFLAWRVTHGHEIIVTGLFVLLSFTVLFLNEISARRSAVNVFICLLALCHVFQSSSFQMVHYSVLFGAPVLVALALVPANVTPTQRASWFLFPALVFLAALLISLPKFYGMLMNAMGDESSRAAGLNVVYSHTTATWADWLSSVPWSAVFIPEGRAASHLHETNYPIGPLAAALLLARFDKRLLIIIVGLVLSLLMALILSVNIEPFSSTMIKVVPLLESFRVPARAILPFVVMVSLLGSAALLHRCSLDSNSAVESPFYWLGAIAIVVVLSFAPSWSNDLLMITTLVGLFFFKAWIPRPAMILVIAMFTGGAVAAFKERAPAPLEEPVSEASISLVRQAIFDQAPELAFPLNRFHSLLSSEHLNLNSHFFWDVSSLSSYWFPLQRYSTLVMTLEGLPYRPTHSLFQNQASNQGFEVLNRLFNVGSELTADDNGYHLSRFGEPYGAVWLSSTTLRYPGWEALAEGLKNQRSPHDMLLLGSDKKTQEINADSCRINNPVTIIPSGFPYRLNLDVEGQCLLTVSMNYTEILKATNQDGMPLKTFPAYGTLLGIVIDSSTSGVSIEPRVTALPAGLLIQLLGFILAIGLLIRSIARLPAQADSRQTQTHHVMHRTHNRSHQA